MHFYGRKELTHILGDAKPRVFITAEGLLMYLPATAQSDLFEGIDGLAASGSHVAVEQAAPMPDEVFAAIGAFGQFVVVDPTTDSVWVRLGPIDLGDASGFGKLPALWNAFEAAQSP